MFKHLLVPTDGSEESETAIRKSIELAKSIRATVTGIHVLPTFHVFTHRTEMLEDTRELFEKDSRIHAAKFLASIERAAQEEGVPCNTVSVMSDQPYEAIIKTAAEQGCDLIAMASHGRKGVKGFLLGSETQKVLVHTQIPVMVFR